MRCVIHNSIIYSYSTFIPIVVISKPADVRDTSHRILNIKQSTNDSEFRAINVVTKIVKYFQHTNFDKCI